MFAKTFVTSLTFVVLLTAMQAVHGAAPPKGTRSQSESQALHEARKNSLHKPVPFVVDLKADFFERYVKPHHWKQERGRFWLVLFYASWCLTCEEFASPIQQLAAKVHDRWEHEHTIVYKSKELPRGQLSIGKHDVTVSEVIADKYGVEGYPTLLLFDRDDDKKITKFEGAPSFESLLAFVRQHTDVKI